MNEEDDYVYDDDEDDADISAPSIPLSPFELYPNNPMEVNLALAANELLTKLFQQALYGNVTANKTLLDRILPPRKLTTTLPSLPVLFNNELTLQQQAEIVMDLTFKGSITVEASNALLNGIKVRSDLDQAAKLVELEAKLNALIEDT